MQCCKGIPEAVAAVWPPAQRSIFPARYKCSPTVTVNVDQLKFDSQNEV